MRNEANTHPEILENRRYPHNPILIISIGMDLGKFPALGNTRRERRWCQYIFPISLFHENPNRFPVLWKTLAPSTLKQAVCHMDMQGSENQSLLTNK
jgi:hypothetical protein